MKFEDMTIEQKVGWIKQGIEEGKPEAIEKYFLLMYGEPREME